MAAALDYVAESCDLKDSVLLKKQDDSYEEDDVCVPTEKIRVALLGSGNWASAISQIVGVNAKEIDLFEDTVNMYVYEEMWKGRKLSEIINTEHENVKYLPGHKLPDNIIAVTDPAEAAKGADVLVVCLPHQFLPRLLAAVKPVIKPGAVAVSLIKGHVEIIKGRPVLGTQVIKDTLGIETAVLMGANVANEVAKGDFCETTLSLANAKVAHWLRRLFHRPTFRVRTCEDVPGTELCGGLKNIIALGVGFCDGVGIGYNTKAAIIRCGLLEMFRFISHFFPEAKRDTLFESCGVADLITTSFGGRNRKCAEAFAKNPERGWDAIEHDLLGGQKLQGVSTVIEVWPLIKARRLQRHLPLMSQIYRIAVEGLSPRAIEEFAVNEGPPCPVAGSDVKPLKVALLGSGSWTTAVAMLIGKNAMELEEVDQDVKMYVIDELIEGVSLCTTINNTKENPKYLPGFHIPDNIIATTDPAEATLDADVIVIGVPPRNVVELLAQIKSSVKPGAVAVSLVKGGMEVRDGKPLLISSVVESTLGVECGVLTGANTAYEVARGDFVESTLATRGQRTGDLLALLFHRPTFQVNEVHDVAGAEMSGGLNCIYALAGGICDGLGQGGNTKAAIIRMGLVEAAAFTSKFYPAAQSYTLFESAGVADLLSMSMSKHGRHRQAGMHFAQHMSRSHRLASSVPLVSGHKWPEMAKLLWADIAEHNFGGWHIIGLDLLHTLWPLVLQHDLQADLPLLCALHAVTVEGEDPHRIVHHDHLDEWVHTPAEKEKLAPAAADKAAA